MPLDSNLPTYYFKSDKQNPHDTSLLFTLFDSEPESRYTLRTPDPASPQARNCYALGLCDPYMPDVVFGEILVKPEWTQPTLSAEEIRRTGGIPPPPLPILPREVTVQLYDPDQQVILEEEKGSWNSSPSYLFSMPQQTFRLPSSSSLDYSASDPAADPSTPQINFAWKKDGRRDMKCFVTGKSTDKGNKKKGGKEPPIIVAMFSDYKELTIYEPNLHRVDMEDYKGLEIALLLTATVIRDVFCGFKKDCFNTGEAPRKNSAGILNRKPSRPYLQASASTANLQATQASGLFSLGRKKSTPNLHQHSLSPASPPGVPPPDPRQQWEIDAETVRLKQIYEKERQAEAARNRERQRKEEEEQARIKRMLEQEERDRRKIEAEQRIAMDKESARLWKLYGNQSNLAPPRPDPQPQRYTYPNVWAPGGLVPPVQHRPQQQKPVQPPRPGQGVYLSPQQGYGARPTASMSSFFHASPQARLPQMPPRPSPSPAYGASRPSQRPSAAASSVNLTMSGANRPSPSSGRPSLHDQRIKPKKSSFWGFLSGDPAPRMSGQR